MRIIDYLRAKYRVLTPTTMLCAEARAFSISYPLKQGWLKDCGDIEITPDIANTLGAALKKIDSGSARAGLAVLEKAWIELKRKPLATDKAFLESKAWKRLRYQALKLCGSKCQACGASPESGAVLNVDHIRPRVLFPELALRLGNLQVLCGDCNEGKGNWDMTDFR